MPSWYSPIIKENIYALSAQFMTFITGLISTILFPNLLGPEQFGYFAIVLAVSHTWFIFTDLGINTCVLFFLPRGMKEGSTQTYYNLLFKWKIIFSLIASFIFFLFSDVLASIYIHSSLFVGFKLGALYLLFLSLFQFYTYVFISLKQAKYYFFLTLILGILRILLGVFLFFLLLSYIGVLLGALGGLLLALLFAVLSLKVPEGSKEINMREVGVLAGYTILGLTAETLFSYVPTSILALFQPPEVVSFYALALSWSSMFILLFPLTPGVLFPAFTFENKEKSLKIYDRMLKYGFIIAFLFIVGVFLFSKKFISLIYGAEFLPSAELFSVFSLLSIEFLLMGAAGPLVGIKGERIDIGPKIRFAASLFLPFLCFFFAPIGLKEVVYSVVGLKLLSAFIFVFFTLKILKISFNFIHILKPLVCAILTYLAFASFIPHIHSVLSGILIICATTFFYTVLLFLTKSITLSEIKQIIRGVS